MRAPPIAHARRAPHREWIFVEEVKPDMVTESEAEPPPEVPEANLPALQIAADLLMLEGETDEAYAGKGIRKAIRMVQARLVTSPAIA